ncbi:2OG-Fe(II) oxygenase [Streptomyces sp. NPDC058467]|uniref:2OG-Fe(II) oxygenase n=1 Tax=Streptomyces sp. NPDC058467 TaxID=3346513 RepID=UPI003655CC75
MREWPRSCSSADWRAFGFEADPSTDAAECADLAALNDKPDLFRTMLGRPGTGRPAWKALHRDVLGVLVFPLQVVIALDAYGTDCTDGGSLLVEQRPRAQSRDHPGAQVVAGRRV